MLHLHWQKPEYKLCACHVCLKQSAHICHSSCCYKRCVVCLSSFVRKRSASDAQLMQLQEQRISTTLVGMASKEAVQKNVEAVLQSLGLAKNSAAAAEEAALAEAQQILRPVHNVTWASGLPENS